MTTTSARGRARVLLAAAVAGTLVAGAVSTTPAVGAARPADPRADLVRALAADDASTGGRVLGAAHASAAPGARKASRTLEAPGAAGVAPSTPSVAATCDAMKVGVTQTLDRTYVVWNPVDNATSISVSRQRFGGSARTIGSALPGGTTSFRDTGQNPMGSAAWFVTATVGSAKVTCRTPSDGGWWSMSSVDGTGYPDLFFAGNSAVYEQDEFGFAFKAWDGAMARPTFSADGRLVAGLEGTGAGTQLTVRVARTGAVLWRVASPAGTALDEPAFSPDGQRIVAGAVDPTDASVSKGLYTIPVWGTHTPRLVPSSAGLSTPDWVDSLLATPSTTLVAADLAPGGGLVRVDASTGARTLLAGTGGGIDPTGLRDGSILFATNTSTEATVKVLAPDGTIDTRQTYPSSDVRWPVMTPDGTVYHFIRYPDPDPNNAGGFLWSVFAVPNTPNAVGEATLVGGTFDGSSPGFQGFDLRTPFSAGSSDFGGSANHDIIARSSTGVLYSYPLSADLNQDFEPRGRIGSGWNVMRQVVTIGDLNGDRHGDLVAVDSSGNLWFYPGRGGFAMASRVKIGTGWSSYAVLGTGDFDGDGRADLIARDSAGRLWLYPGSGTGGVLPRRQIGSGWSIFNAIIGPGDWNYDGRTDLLARDRSGVLYLYPGNGSGGFGTRSVLGRGWDARFGFAAVEVWGGVNALFTKTSTGQLLDYDSVGDGVMNSNYVFLVGTGWSSYTITG
ncbi:FG-GAP-like repeat-containing protein [Phycicoccus avicenniae]|uniref:VCBS repeat-containing protein n=1 Tax=Phycicoccus avicenniae TaxID=2828860 RepID=UPI003D28F424